MLLLVDDDAKLAEQLAAALRDEGFEVRTAPTAEAARSALQEEVFDLILLDRVLQDSDGYDIIRALRKSDISTPIIMLTGRTSETEKVSGLELGADDYVTKPFSLPELIARIRVQLRRNTAAEPQPVSQREILTLGNIHIDVGARIVVRNGEALSLTKNEFDLLHYLALNPNRALSREQLIDHVWSEFLPAEIRAVDSCIKRLREKLAGIDVSPDLIDTVRGVGYRLNAEVKKHYVR